MTITNMAFKPLFGLDIRGSDRGQLMTTLNSRAGSNRVTHKHTHTFKEFFTRSVSLLAPTNLCGMLVVLFPV